MALLQIYIPENWPMADNPGPLEWALRDAQGNVTSSGSAPLAELPKGEVEVIVPAAAVLLTSAKLPKGSRSQQRRLLPYAVEERIAAEPEAVHVALGPRLETGEFALAVTDRAWLERALERLAEGGLRPSRAFPETLLGRIEAGCWSAVWSGAEGWARTGPCSGIALDGGSEETPPLALSLAVREEPPEKILLHSRGGALLPDLAKWSGALGVPVSAGSDWQWARQKLDAAHAINLLQGDFAPAGVARELMPRLRPLLMLAAAIVLLQAGAASVDWWLQKRETRQLQGQIEQNFRKAFPEAKVIVDAPLQMRRNLAELRAAAGAMGPGDFLPLLAQVGAAATFDGGRLRALEYQGAVLKMDLLLPSRQDAEALDRALQGAGLSSRLESAAARGGEVEARIVITGGRP